MTINLTNHTQDEIKAYFDANGLDVFKVIHLFDNVYQIMFQGQRNPYYLMDAKDKLIKLMMTPCDRAFRINIEYVYDVFSYNMLLCIARINDYGRDNHETGKKHVRSHALETEKCLV